MNKGMTKEQVMNHLKDYKTYQGKIDYLANVLSKKEILSPKTEDSVKEAINDLKKNPDYVSSQRQAFQIDRETVNNLSSKGKEFEKRAIELEKSGNFQEAKDMFEKAADSYSSAAQARDYYQGAEAEKAVKNYEKVGRLDKMADIYELGHEPIKAKIIRNKLKSRLENRMVAVIATASILGSLFFFSSNLTGNIIGNLNQTVSNGIGGILFVLGLVGAFVYFRKR